MAKIYFKRPVDKAGNLEPREEAVKFLLNYSKALSIIDYNKMKFETVLN